MKILIDILVCLFIFITIYINSKKGLIEVAYKIVAFFIAIIISLILFRPISALLINNTNIDEYVNNYVVSTIDRDSNEEKTDNKEKNSIPKIFDNAINSAKQETTQLVSNSITNTVINVISFIAVFIITRIILIFLHIFSEAIGNLPLIKQFNHLGGLLYGILKAFIIIFILLALISVLPLTSLQEIISSTIITRILYNINPILLLFYMIIICRSQRM